MPINVNGCAYRTLADEIFVNGERLMEAYVDGEKVYPSSRAMAQAVFDAGRSLGPDQLGYYHFTRMYVIYPPAGNVTLSHGNSYHNYSGILSSELPLTGPLVFRVAYNEGAADLQPWEFNFAWSLVDGISIDLDLSYPDIPRKTDFGYGTWKIYVEHAPLSSPNNDDYIDTYLTGTLVSGVSSQFYDRVYDFFNTPHRYSWKRGEPMFEWFGQSWAPSKGRPYTFNDKATGWIAEDGVIITISPGTSASAASLGLDPSKPGWNQDSNSGGVIFERQVYTRIEFYIPCTDSDVYSDYRKGRDPGTGEARRYYDTWKSETSHTYKTDTLGYRVAEVLLNLYGPDFDSFEVFEAT